MLCRILLLCLFGSLAAAAQDNASPDISRLSAQYTRSVDQKISGIDRQLTKQSKKYLNRLSREEEKIRARMEKLDSSKAAALFRDSQKTYEQLSQKLNAVNGKASKALSGRYLPYLDSLQGSLGFLKEAKDIISRSKDLEQKLGSSLEQVKQLQSKMQQAEEIRLYVQQRQQQIVQSLAGYTHLPKDLAKYLGSYRQQVYYYGRQLQEYKTLLNDPDKLLRKMLAVLQDIPTFRKFMGRYGMLAGVFAPAASSAAPDPRLPMRSQVMQLVQQRIASGGANGQQAFSQQLQAAQGELTKLKDKLGSLGISEGDGDMTMPAYRPNRQKTKTFLRRIEYGANMQSQRATSYFPVSTAVTATAGYKVNDKSIVGIGLSGTVGWGKDWKHIKLTGQGIGTRFFVDWKARGNIWLTAGAEMNYTRPVESLEVFKNYSAWNKSALTGISKKYKAGKKLKGNMQVLYDFLHSRNTPPTPAVVWRVGYNF
jgi:hypothetical protein